MSRRSSLFILLPVLWIGCASPPPYPDAELRQRARELAGEALIIDSHVDVPYRLEERPDNVAEWTAGGDFDYPRAKLGGLDAPFLSIYVPAALQETGGAFELAERLIDGVEAIAAAAPQKFGIAHSPADVELLAGEGRLALPMGMENGAPIGDDLANLEHFHRRGISYITLTHAKDNQICDSSYVDAAERRWQGLSPFGRLAVAEMNRLGIMIDVSHVTDQTFYQVMEISTAPVIASHSSCRRFTPGWERNMDDEMIRMLAENGGVIQINFGSAFLRGDARVQSEAFWGAAESYSKEHALERGDPELRAWAAEYWSEREKIFADLSDVVAHIDHVVEIAGIDAVGLGSDFDGVGDSLPTGLKDVSHYPNLIFELLKAGYSEDEVRKILGGNLMRVWRQVESVAEARQAEQRAVAISGS